MFEKVVRQGLGVAGTGGFLAGYSWTMSGWNFGITFVVGLTLVLWAGHRTRKAMNAVSS